MSAQRSLSLCHIASCASTISLSRRGLCRMESPQPRALALPATLHSSTGPARGHPPAAASTRGRVRPDLWVCGVVVGVCGWVGSCAPVPTAGVIYLWGEGAAPQPGTSARPAALLSVPGGPRPSPARHLGHVSVGPAWPPVHQAARPARPSPAQAGPRGPVWRGARLMRRRACRSRQIKAGRRREGAQNERVGQRQQEREQEKKDRC